MAQLSEIAGELDMAARAELAAAWLAIGRRDRAAAVLPDGTMDGQVPRSTGGRITSQVRQEAVLLDVLIDLDPRHPWIVPLVRRLEQVRKEGCWGTTLENATALAALARYQMLGADESRFTGTIRLADGTTRAFDQAMTASVEVPAAGLPVEVSSSGTGDVYVSVVFEGLAAQEEIEPYDHQLAIRRRWLDTKGEPLAPERLKVGDLVRVEVELLAPELPDFRAVDNVAVVDALPAGMEVENPRLATSAQSDAGEARGDQPDRVEFHDDRVLLFGSAVAGPQVFRYDLRVITAGEFVVPPIQASCMYDPDFASLHGGGRVVVSR